MIKKLCAYTGCNKAIPFMNRYCDIHTDKAKQLKADNQAYYDKTVRLIRDGTIHEFYLSPEWEMTTLHVNDKFKGLCLWSYYHGEIVKADAVHHIEPVRTNWNLRLDIKNLIPLSHAIHMKVEAAYRRSEKSKLKMQMELMLLLIRWAEEFERGRGI